MVAFDNVTLGIVPPLPPVAPTALTATVSGKNEVQLKWTNLAKNHTGYKVEAARGNGIFYEITDLPSSATEFVNTGLTNPTALRFRVRAYNTGGFSEYSNATEGLVPADPAAIAK